jgi:hypothetical protein
MCPRASPFRQGDPADRFYVIETGTADVVGDGRVVTKLGPGDGFGEIALLRRLPRTATVRAASDLELQALTCNRFLPVVSGFPPSAGRRGPRSGKCSIDSTRKNRMTINKTGQRSKRAATLALKSDGCGADCRNLLSALFQRESFFFPGGKAV